MTDFKDPDQPLVEAVQSAAEGDLRAFEELIVMHRKRILADCQYMTHDRSNAEDLAQDVFVKAFFGIRKFEGRSSFRHWLQRIKVHHCLNHLKKRESHESVLLDEAVVEGVDQLQVQPVASRDLEAMDERLKIQGILEAMPDTLRVPLIMRDMDEFTYEEIAGALGIGISAVKMRIKRGREFFKQSYLAGDGSPQGHAVR